jgi:alcohol dehydrogenase class IV
VASEEENARAAILAIESLAQEVMGGRISGLDMTEQIMPLIVEDTLSDLVLGNTPRMPKAEDVREILSSAS